MKITAQKRIEEEIPSVEAFRDKHPNVEITHIDGEPVFDCCEGCGKPILVEDPNFRLDIEGIAICTDCDATEEGGK